MFLFRFLPVGQAHPDHHDSVAKNRAVQNENLVTDVRVCFPSINR